MHSSNADGTAPNPDRGVLSTAGGTLATMSAHALAPKLVQTSLWLTPEQVRAALDDLAG